MEHARLGRTGFDVSVVSLGSGGASKLGSSYGLGFDDSVAVVRTAMENGVTSIDTAGGYGTESIVGAAIKGHRDEIVLSSKSSIHADPFSLASDLLTAGEFRAHVEESLEQLGTDVIDIFYVHGLHLVDYDYCLGEIVPELERLRTEGKVRALGLSEPWNSDRRHEMLTAAVGDDHFDVLMVGLNILNQSALRYILPVAVEKDLGVQCMYAVRGRLAFAETARELVNEAIEAGEIDPADVERANPLGFLVEPGVADTLTEACYRFDRHALGVQTVLTGTGSVDHLLDNIRAINGPPLPDPILDRLERVFGRVESVNGD